MQDFYAQSSPLITAANKISGPSEIVNPSDAAKTDRISPEDVDEALFLPPQQAGQPLMYASANMQYFLLYFYAIYERLCCGFELVKAKVRKDLADDFGHMGLRDKLSAEDQDRLVHERFQYVLKAIMTTMLQTSSLSVPDYEDLARQLLGNDSYLLFQVEKIVGACLRQLHAFANDPAARAASEAYEECKELTESEYLTRFYKAACGQEIVNLPQLSGAAALTRDNVNPLLVNVAFRLLYSRKSQILTVHFVSFNPYPFSALDSTQK